jgi:uracil-DNA glycosylase
VSETKSKDIRLEQSWKDLLHDEFSQEYFKKIRTILLQEKQQGIVHYPPDALLFNALDRCPVKKVRVVILGQDPYHGPGQAHGLSFSVPQGIAIPKSLQNIYKELSTDIEGFQIPQHGNLEKWADQGVLLLNASLSVRAHEAGSHAQIGWHQFTDTLIKKLAQEHEGLIFVLWGAHARKKKELIPSGKGHYILEAPHPSPLSAHRGFFGCRHFSRANKILEKMDLTPIDWQV